MPIYEYACPDCGHKFDEIQKFADDPITVCPKCAMTNVRKLISQTSFILKGGGWYKDHYGLKPGGDGESKSVAGKSESKSESRSEGAKDAGSAPAAAPAAPSTAGASSSSSGSGGSGSSSSTTSGS